MAQRMFSWVAEVEKVNSLLFVLWWKQVLKLLLWNFRTKLESWPCWMKNAWDQEQLLMRPFWKSWTRSVPLTSISRAGWASAPGSSTTPPCPTAASGSSIMLARYLLEGAPGLWGAALGDWKIHTCLNLFCLKARICDLGWKALRDLGMVLVERDLKCHLVPNPVMGRDAFH